MKDSKKYDELNDIQKLKISKVFLYNKIDSSLKHDSNIVFENNKMKYLFIGEEIIDL